MIFYISFLDIMLYEPERISGMDPTDDNSYDYLEPKLYVMLRRGTQPRSNNVYMPLKDTFEKREVEINPKPVGLYKDVQNTSSSFPPRNLHTIRRPSIPLPDIPGEMKASGTDFSHQPQLTKPQPTIETKPSGITMDSENKTRNFTLRVAVDCDGATGNNVHQTSDGCSLQTASITSLQDVPKDISHLSVGEIGDCLRLLQMENHIEDFKHMQIDGKLLVTIDAFRLKQVFGMSLFHANTLIQFCRGWRP